jgi:hypothetical protein
MAKPQSVDEAIEQFAAKHFSPRGRRVSVRVDDGLPRRGLLYRTDKPFPPIVHELVSPEGKPFTVEVRCLDGGYVLVSWGEVRGVC